MPCSTIQVQDEPDESTLIIGDVSTTSPTPGVVVVEYLAINQITSGDGETITRDVVLTVDGSEVNRQSETVSPSQDTTQSVELTGLTPGSTVEVCVTVE